MDESSTIEQELIRLDKEWNDAEVRCDLVILDRILADEFISTWLDGTLETKAKVLEDFRSGDVNFESMTCNDYRVRVYGDIVVVNHRTVLKGQYKSEDFGMTYRTTHVWLKRDGRWAGGRESDHSYGTIARVKHHKFNRMKSITADRDQGG